VRTGLIISLLHFSLLTLPLARSSRANGVAFFRFSIGTILLLARGTCWDLYRFHVLHSCHVLGSIPFSRFTQLPRQQHFLSCSRSCCVLNYYITLLYYSISYIILYYIAYILSKFNFIFYSTFFLYFIIVHVRIHILTYIYIHP
jgi:hypothetical protein